MSKVIDRDKLDYGQFPDAFEYQEIDPDSEIKIKPKNGYTLGATVVYFGEYWRVRPSGGTLFIEWKNAGTWEEQGRFETP